MAIPKTVQRQLDAAEATLQNTAVAAGATQDDVVTDISQLSEPAPVVVEAPAPTPAQAPAPAPKPDDSMEQRFRTLQGMWNAERAQNKTLESQLNQLTQQVQALNTASTTKSPGNVPETPKADPRDAAEFGEDLVAMVQRYVTGALELMRKDVAGTAGDLDRRLKVLEGQINGVSQKTDMTLEQAFYGTLDQTVPDWRQINVDDRWLAWLGEVDEVYGAPRQVALDTAHQRMDAKRVIAIFNQFKATQPTRPTLNSQQTPDNAGQPTPTPQAEPGKRMVSQRLIKQFYDDLARGKYRGREAESERLQLEIDKAVAEGRVA
jgi:hypothetical protein